MALYFAYGSNMESAQMALRVPDARVLGRARLRGYRFACNKIGRDGSAKANVESCDGLEVWGVLFEISDGDLSDLDRFEGGYRRIAVTVESRPLTQARCEIYVSDQRSADLRPTRTYRDRMARGAREHGLPEECCRALAALGVAD